MVAAFAPVALDSATLVEALERLVERFGRETGLATRLDTAALGDGGAELSRSEEVVLLRGAQEALANVRRHASATAVVLRVSRVGRGSRRRCRCTWRTTGRLRPGRAPGVGLAGLRDRVEEVGGAVDVVSAPGEGTRVTVRVPASMTVRVLVVDDHPVVRGGVVGWLAAQPDIDVVGEASDGLEALAAGGRARAGRRPDGPADAAHGRRRGDRADRGRAPRRPGAGADHVRHRRRHRARGRGRRDRLPAQGHPAAAAGRGGAGGGAGRDGAGAAGGRAAGVADAGAGRGGADRAGAGGARAGWRAG